MTNHNSPQPTEQPEGEGKLISRMIQAQIGTNNQHDIIQRHMDDYFKRFPSYEEKLTRLEWYHLFLDFMDALQSPQPESVDALGEESFEEIYEQLWEWHQATFDTPAINAVSGLLKEGEELRSELESGNRVKALVEAVDCFNYLLYVVRKSGFSLPDLKKAHAHKFEILKQREWKKREDGCYQHIPASQVDAEPSPQEAVVKEWREECERLAKVAEHWQAEYYKLKPPYRNPKLDNL